MNQSDTPVDKPKITLHELVISIDESTIALSVLTKEDLEQIQTWVENDEVEYEVFSRFDCGPGPNGPDVEQLCDQLEIATEHVSPEGTETHYKHDHLYIETIERYCNSELSITVSLPNAIPFTPSDIVLKHHPRNTNVVTDIQYPNGEVSWQIESEFEIDEREWNFYKCINGDLVWVDIEEEIALIFENE